jgi:hypothetical protein
VSKAQPFNWSLSKSFGAHGLICEGCKAFGIVVMGCGAGVGASGIGTRFFDSLVLIILNKFARFSFVMWLASTCLVSCFSIAWNHSMSIATDLAVCEVFWRGIRG